MTNKINFDLNRPVRTQIAVPKDNDFDVAIKFTLNGEQLSLSSGDVVVKQAGNDITTTISNDTAYATLSAGEGFEEIDVAIDQGYDKTAIGTQLSTLRSGAAAQVWTKVSADWLSGYTITIKDIANIRYDVVQKDEDGNVTKTLTNKTCTSFMGYTADGKNLYVSYAPMESTKIQYRIGSGQYILTSEYVLESPIVKIPSATLVYDNGKYAEMSAYFNVGKKPEGKFTLVSNAKEATYNFV